MIKRAQIVDLLKGIAVLLMIQVHIIELFAANNISDNYLYKILLFLGGPPVAPVFVAVMGYFLAASVKTTKQLIIRGIKTICLGMGLNIALNFNLIISVQKGLLQIDLLPYIFGIDILQFAGLAIIFIAVLRNVFAKSFTAIAFTIFISAFLGQYLMEYIPADNFRKYLTAPFYGSCNWSYFPLFPWISYPLAGFAFYRIQKKYDLSFFDNVKIKILSVILFVVFMVFTIKYAISESSNLQVYYHHNLLFMQWVLVFLAFYTFLAKELNGLQGENFLLKYLKWLGKNVTFIYIIQWIIIGNIATEIYRTVSSPLYLLSWFISILAVSSAICFTLIKIKKRFTAS